MSSSTPNSAIERTYEKVSPQPVKFEIGGASAEKSVEPATATQKPTEICIYKGLPIACAAVRAARRGIYPVRTEPYTPRITNPKRNFPSIAESLESHRRTDVLCETACRRSRELTEQKWKEKARSKAETGSKFAAGFEKNQIREERMRASPREDRQQDKIAKGFETPEETDDDDCVITHFKIGSLENPKPTFDY